MSDTLSAVGVWTPRLHHLTLSNAKHSLSQETRACVTEGYSSKEKIHNTKHQIWGSHLLSTFRSRRLNTRGHNTKKKPIRYWKITQNKANKTTADGESTPEATRNICKHAVINVVKHRSSLRQHIIGWVSQIMDYLYVINRLILLI